VANQLGRKMKLKGR